MRPIKFRFGYTDGTNWIFKMFTLDECLNGDPLEAMSNNPLLKNYVMKSRDLFTGLHDKNGKEIYGSIYLDGKLTKGGDVVSFYYKGSIVKC